jgi:hypothetical protein
MHSCLTTGEVTAAPPRPRSQRSIPQHEGLAGSLLAARMRCLR